MTDSTRIIGKQQFEQAVDLFNLASNQLTGSIDYRHMFVDMENVVVSTEFTGLEKAVKTCTAALGDGFAAGTTDGPGDFNFKQGTNSSSTNPFWNFIGRFLADPPQEQIVCHAPKPILLYTGGIDLPTKWAANILPIQMFKVGQLYILGVPAEFTTMAGRRLKDTVKQALISAGSPTNITVVIAGLSNAYSQYVATTEEYHIQRYEGASTLYGPYTLPAYQQLYSALAVAIAKNSTVPPGPLPQDFQGKVPDFLPPVVFDDGPVGTVQNDAQSSYHVGGVVTVTFYSADPRNNFWDVKTFLTVERKNTDGSFTIVATDGNWETKFFWKRLYNIELGESVSAVQWEIPQNTPAGTYRIGHFGNSKNLFGQITPFSVYTSIFQVS